ncbi:MAG TPA: hypothetical protein VMA77_11065 [Solirubrobacteraceae bacterium]|nr:hypothetical protein [Solirubrobacteraceae bacterium]
MTTFEATRRAALKTRGTTEAIITTLGVLVAIGAAVLILALTGAIKTGHAAPSGPSPAYAPLAQFYGTGAPPTARTNQRPTSSNSGTANPSRHFYGLQP